MASSACLSESRRPSLRQTTGPALRRSDRGCSTPPPACSILGRERFLRQRVDPILDQRVGSEPAQDRPGIARALQAGRHAMNPSPMRLSSVPVSHNHRRHLMEVLVQDLRQLLRFEALGQIGVRPCPRTRRSVDVARTRPPARVSRQQPFRCRSPIRWNDGLSQASALHAVASSRSLESFATRSSSALPIASAGRAVTSGNPALPADSLLGCRATLRPPPSRRRSSSWSRSGSR